MTVNSPKISIVIPSFNKSKYISKTLDSIFHQKYSNYEVVIQDGGSTDGTVAILKKYAKRYPGKMIWESKKDKGQLEAVNLGIKKTNGDIVTFINADDYYNPRTFEFVAKAFIKEPKKLWFVGKGVVINEKNLEIAKPVTMYKNFLMLMSKYRFLLITNYLMQPSVFITKKAYKKYGPFRGTQKFIMEYDMWLRLGKIEMPVIINKVLSRFRIESSTKTKTMFNEILKEDEKIFRMHSDDLFINLLHQIHNLGRKVIGRFV